MKPRQLFPLGKAYGKAFCNRVEEARKLLGNIESCKHSYLLAPRRYGKSSLCEKVLEQTSLPWLKLDFHLAITEKDAERIIMNGMSNLTGKAIGPVEKLINIIKKYTKNLKPKFGIGSKSLHLEFEVSSGSSAAENIAEALLILDKMLISKKKQAVLLFDEFQEIGMMDNGKALEGAIRHVAQETQQLSFIFSGSNPHLIKNMFEDERRPLYKLCRKLILDRIHEKDYKLHLNKAAKALWKKELPEAVFQQIMYVSERHPYYVNYLCDVLCSEVESLPTVEDVKTAWNMVVEEEKSDLLKDFSSLPENQKKVMVYIANNGGNNLYSNEASKIMDLPSSSVARALTTLIEKDYIEKTGNDYRLIVPVYKSLLWIEKL